MIRSIQELKNSVECGYIEDTKKDNSTILPQFIVNNDKQKVATTLRHELESCDEFYFSVAFVVESGIMQFLSILQELEKKGVKGKILASQYQNFTEPKALRRLLKFKNIELRVVTSPQYSMHAKGYIFKKGDYYTMLVGSSNLTATALTTNLEWNLKISSHKDGYIAKNALSEFDRMFNLSTACDEEWINAYEKIYKNIKSFNEEIDNPIQKDNFHPSPNKMQAQALASLINLRKQGKDKALIISATGTGKTYLAAFDVNIVKPKKFLFIVHRERIAEAAMNAFKRVCGKDISMTLLGGGRKYDKNAQYVFAMIETLNRDSTLIQFDPKEFDYILVDEAHHICASTYVKVIEYFKPKFMLGMTATPDRTDSSNAGKDVYKFFDYNIAYEIRLSQAMEMDLIAPFHYFGITDLTIDGEIVEDHSNFNKLVADERVKNIVKQIDHYGYSGDRVKGLVFCASVQESEELSNKFNALGYKTVALSAKNSDAERADAIKRLEQDEKDGSLDYIFLKDIFNEGIDIPEVNQVILLRPTESAIIFIQQLGRGLRKNAKKEFVVILDFIGNYTNNFFIPVALFGDNSYSPRAAREHVVARSLPGSSTVDFDPIAREQIFKAIDSSAFGDIKLIKGHYFDLKKRLGRIPNMIDFTIYDTIDIFRIINKFGSYQHFLTKYEPDLKVNFSQEELSYFKHASQNFATGHRMHEILFLESIIDNPKDIISHFENSFAKISNKTKLTKKAFITVLKEFEGSFFVNNNETYIKKVNGRYVAVEKLEKLLKNSNFVKEMKEIISIGKYNYNHSYTNNYKNTDLVLYKLYTRTEVCKLLNWNSDQASTVFGGKYHEYSNSYPIFVTYNKAADISSSINYNDAFISPDKFIWTSTNVPINNNPITSYSKISSILETKTKNGIMPLFIKKSDNDTHFYFMGFVDRPDDYEEITLDSKTRALKFIFDMETPVANDIYTYMTAKI